MVPLRKEALALSGSLNTWRKLFSHWPTDSDVITLELPEKLNEASHQIPRVSFGFAVADVLLTRARLIECCSALAEQWPLWRDWCEELLTQTRLEDIFPDKLLSNENRMLQGLGLQDLEEISSYIQSARYEVSLDSKLSFVFEYRDSILRSMALAELRYARSMPGQMRQQVNEIFHSVAKNLEFDDQTRWHLKQYLANDYLPPWLFYKGEFENNYEVLFQKIYSADRGLVWPKPDLELSSSAFDQNVRLQIDLFANRLTRSISDMRYQDYVYAAIAGGGQWGLNSAIGTADNVHIIPNTERRQRTKSNNLRRSNFSREFQPKITIAFAASQDRRRKTFFTKVMNNLREHLQIYTEQAAIIIVTDIWDPELLKDNLLNFEQYKTKSEKFVFLQVIDNAISQTSV
jgi:hypothetical protein